MRSKEIKSEFLVINEEGLSLSGKALTELLQSILAKEASFRFKVRGFSMSPFIRDSDVLSITSFNNGRIGFGQTVAFIHPQTEKLVIHRIIGNNPDGYLIKGDNAWNIDSLVPRENILGAVTRIERKGKQVSLGLGWERLVIALLSKSRLWSLAFWMRRFLISQVRRFV